MPVGGTTTPRAVVGTVGMFIIDSFQYLDDVDPSATGDASSAIPANHPPPAPLASPPRQEERRDADQAGGGGTFFAVGARVWLPPHAVRMVIDDGGDIPPSMRVALDNFADPDHLGAGPWLWRRRPDGRGTTRALNTYAGEHRGFEYLSPKLRLNPIDLVDDASTPPSLPAYLHAVCSPRRLLEMASQACAIADPAPPPFIVWEPIPDSAIPENLPTLLDAMRHVAVVSPNHEEAAACLLDWGADRLQSQLDDAGACPDNAARRKWILDVLALGLWTQYHRAHPQPPRHLCSAETAGAHSSALHAPACPVVVVRAAALGSCFVTCELSGPGEALHRPCSGWVDAYHTSAMQDKVVDVTGAGNAFMGGLAAHLASHLPHPTLPIPATVAHAALLRAAVSASFVVEQRGMPLVRRATDNYDHGGGDGDGDGDRWSTGGVGYGGDKDALGDRASSDLLWNGDRPERRLLEMERRGGHSGPMGIREEGRRAR
ncbi:hypothetical protein HK405_001160 [Cladochytrium tenue]|nr:hypothetical protein HK405_001160 [Cladochytrium tenue]